MKGYIVINTEVVDAEAYAEFIEKIPAVVAAHGGRFLVRTSDAESIEGDWEPKRLVIMEFDNVEAARGFINSTEYGALSDIRHKAARSSILVAAGSDS